MKVLVIGGGGREHALAWKVAQSPRVTRGAVAPGNAGTAPSRGAQRRVAADDVAGPRALAQREQVDLTIVGPEAPLVLGVVDAFAAAGLRCFGPSRAAAQLEGSKAFTKDFLQRHGIPTAAYAHLHARRLRPGLGARAAGAARREGRRPRRRQGRGDLRHRRGGDRDHARACSTGSFGTAGDKVVIEEFLEGEEASFIAMVDGTHVLPLATSQDHKRLRDGDAGPNTGGMGAYSPAPVVTPADPRARHARGDAGPPCAALAAEGTPYTGFLYAGLMIAADGTPNVLEFNCRFGDPETQPILARLRSDLTVLCDAALDGRLDAGSTSSGIRAPPSAWCWPPHGYPDDRAQGRRDHGLDAAAQLPGKVFHAGTRAARTARW